MAIVRNTDSLTIHGVDIKTILGGSRYRYVFARQTDGVGIFNRHKPSNVTYRQNIEAAEAKLKMLGLRKGIDYKFQEYDKKKKKNLGIWIRPCRNKFGTASYRQAQLRAGERMMPIYRKAVPCTKPTTEVPASKGRLLDRVQVPASALVDAQAKHREELQALKAATPTPTATPGWQKAAWVATGIALSYAAYTYLLPLVG